MGCRDDSTVGGESTQVPAKWGVADIPSLEHKVAIVTGANSGIGYVTARELARHGAHVVLACRSEQRGREAEAKLSSELAGVAGAGSVVFAKLDVSSLESVKSFADDFKRTHDRLDVLVNNAGIMAVPYTLTVDGIESQFATNHLGHFALTAQLFELLKASAPSRIINVSSVMHRFSRLAVEDLAAAALNSEAAYSRLRAYNNSKLSNLLFTAELTRRLRARGIDGVAALAAHPGYTASNLLGTPGSSATWWSWFSAAIWGLGKTFRLGQTPEAGALPTLFAATAERARSGDFFGPKRLFRLAGAPALEQPSTRSRSEPLAAKLWAESEQLAHVTFTL